MEQASITSNREEAKQRLKAELDKLYALLDANHELTSVGVVLQMRSVSAILEDIFPLMQLGQSHSVTKHT